MHRQTSVRKTDSWIDREMEAAVFPDARLGKRFRSLVRRLWNGVGDTIPFACQDWSNAKAAYRFFRIRAPVKKRFCPDTFRRQPVVSQQPVGRNSSRLALTPQT